MLQFSIICCVAKLILLCAVNAARKIDCIAEVFGLLQALLLFQWSYWCAEVNGKSFLGLVIKSQQPRFSWVFSNPSL